MVARPDTRIRFGCSKSMNSIWMCGFSNTLPNDRNIPLPS